MRKEIAAFLFGLTVATGLAITPLSASADAPVPVVSECNQGWYVNGDESDLLPKQTEAGLLFDGPSIVHHATDPVALTDVPEVGFEAVVDTGSAPLFKMETTAPYSTVNVKADGKVWSSKIQSGVGSQDIPVTLDALADLAPYTSESRVVTFGVGYANDSGNKATVTSITYGTTYKLGCVPPTETPTPTPTATPTDEPTTPPAKPACEAYDYTRNPNPGNLCGLTLPKDPNCDDIGYRVTLLDPNVDPWRLDQGGDAGIGCESKPLKFGDGSSPTATPTATPTGTPPAPTNPPTQPQPSLSPVGGALPVTGDRGNPMLFAVPIGVLMVSVGAIMLLAVRRRRDAGTVESA